MTANGDRLTRRGRTSNWLPLVGLCALAVLAATTIAASPKPPATDYLRHTFTTEDGLPSNVVNDLLQTRDGFLVVGTANGVYRFDGHRFAEMNSDPPKEILVHSLAEAPDGDLWVATRFGVYRFPHAEIPQRSQSLTVYNLGQGVRDSVRYLRFTRAGVLWAGTPYGLFYFAKDHFQQVAEGNVQRIEETPSGHLLVAITPGFFEWDGSRVIEQSKVLAALGIHADDLYHVLQDHSGVTWYCTRDGVIRQSGDSVKRLMPNPAEGKNGVFQAYEDSAGNVWFRAASGLFRASYDALERVTPEINFRAFTTDRDGNLWVGTNGSGLVRYKNRPIRTFTKADGLPNNVVMAVLATADGKLWAGNNCGGLSWFDGQRFHTYDEKDGLANSCVNALAEDSKHDLWVGTAGGGLFRFHAGHFQAFTKTDGLGSNTVTCVLVARDGSLWVGTVAGLTRIRDGTLRNYTAEDGLSHRTIGNVFQDSHGVIWVSTGAGIDRLDGEKFVAAFRPKDHRELYIAGESPSGDLYVSVGGLGVSRLKDGRLMGIARLNGVQIQAVQKDLWIAGGTGGITRIGAAALRSWEGGQKDPIDYTEFGRADGLLLEECANGYPNMTTTKDGKLWIATLGGAAMMDVSTPPPAPRRPFEYIGDVEVDRKKGSAGRELILPPGMHHTELQLGSIELSSPERVHLQYRLEGIDSEWLDAKPDGTAVYTTIPNGSYLLHMRASNGYGSWDREGIAYRITQQPFFYETDVFKGLVVCAGCILLIGAYRYKVRQESTRIKVGLEERVAERERIARELHDTLLQSFQASVIQMQTARNIFPRRPEVAVQTLKEAIGGAQQAIDEARDTIQGLRTTHPSIELDRLLTLAGQELAKAEESIGTQPVVEVRVKGTRRTLASLLQDELYRIGREVLRNAFQHARARHIEVEIIYDERELRIQIRDDGTGIDPSVLRDGAKAGHWGLPGIRERAKRIGARVDIWSEAGAGTEIELTVPASKVYATPLVPRRFGLFRSKTDVV